MRVSLQQAAELLNSGQVVAVPTETVYGLAAGLKQQDAVEKIFALKGRPANNPLIIHLSCSEELALFTEACPDDLLRLEKAFWPGPMTLVLPVRLDAVPVKVRAGLPTAAFRVPLHPQARALLRLTGPLVMPSANLSGRPSATSAEHVETDFGRDFPVLDGGACTKGLESTILIFKSGLWSIIRQGAFAPQAFEPVLGYVPQVEIHNSKAPLCPGQLYRHYAPRAHLKLVTKFTEDMQGVVVGFCDRQYPSQLRVVSLGSESNPEEVAEGLYRTLRQLDEEGIAEAWLDFNLPSEGLWQTIAERLAKAAQVPSDTDY